MPFTTIVGQQIHFAQRRPVPTSLPPVVFIHGAGGTHQHWLYQVRDLPCSPSYVPDLPGHGRSEGPAPGSIQAHGDWLIAFLDATGLERAVLVGHSMGGAIALDVALRYPARVSGLGLVATGARLRVASAILDGIQQDTEAAVRLICQWAFGPEAPQEMVRLGRRQMSATPPDVLYSDFAACNTFDIRDHLGEIATPTIVLAGTHDRLTPAKYAVYLRDHISDAGLCLIEGAGHMVMIERPSAVVQALAALLKRL